MIFHAVIDGSVMEKSGKYPRAKFRVNSNNFGDLKAKSARDRKSVRTVFNFCISIRQSNGG
jgi:hypothetical protein